ncbi:tRNA pseudouridine(55) synthase TruB [Oceanobacillus sp. FSL H7-0719]|uniref:tRNA pseudouridine(55) synthase TruB n=1 Tax=Oceanobacillus sp. FSL H7-0719 TaxID=2954507 RepID=UPI003254C01D
MEGILPLWKPKGMTSHDCVMKIRRIFQTRKVGHTGTLDPEVEGVLPICIGQATKIVPFLTDTKKIYIAEVKLGQTTETEDSYGNIIKEAAVDSFPSEEQIRQTLEMFQGDIVQVPPMYSAVKVNGRKLYEYARANETVERPKRSVHIYDIEYLGCQPESNTIRFKATCSKGTYIRTLCVDIGGKLGFPAHMSFLERIQTGAFTEEEAVTFEQINQAAVQDNLHSLLEPITMGVEHLAKLEVDKTTKEKITHGQKLPRPEQLPATNPFVVMHKSEFLAIYQLHPNNEDEIKAVRVFNG